MVMALIALRFGLRAPFLRRVGRQRPEETGS
jgi:hypothetical protein